MSSTTSQDAGGKVFIHYGSYESIPQNASPGLLFLKELLPRLDSLEPDAKPITLFLAPGAGFVVNGGNPSTIDVVQSMFKMRSEKLSLFRHDVKVAWDIEKSDMKRTVMYESVSVTTFK